MGNNVFLSEEGMEQFDKAIRLLNASIQEFSNIADQMIPQQLLEGGLNQYLEEFCQFLTTEKGLHTIYNNALDHKEIKDQVSLILFRCFRSLIYLILKYEEVSLLHVELSEGEHHYYLILQENRNTMVNNTENSEIMNNLQNIQNLLETHGGKLEIMETSSSYTFTLTMDK